MLIRGLFLLSPVCFLFSKSRPVSGKALQISGLQRLRRASPGTTLHLDCQVGLEEEEQEQEEKEQEQGEQTDDLELTWSRRSESEERLVSRVAVRRGRAGLDQQGQVVSFLPGYRSVLVTENTEDSWRYSWRLIIEKVSPHNSAVYQCKVRET